MLLLTAHLAEHLALQSVHGSALQSSMM